MNLKPKLIYNPTAGQGKALTILPKVEALLAERGFDYDLVLTEYHGHALELAHQAVAEGRELVVAAGGDGTMNEVINGLMQNHAGPSRLPALGVLPVGRGNDFAFGVGIPMDLSLACDALAAGKHRRIDIGRVTGGDFPQGRFFGNGVGLGFDTVVGFEAAKMKWLHGTASYLVAVIKTIFSFSHAPVYEIITDQTSLTQPFLLVSIMNGRRMGGSFMMAPNGVHGDGKFDLCLAGQVSQIRILPLAATFISGKQAGQSAVKMLQATRVTIRAIQGTIPAHADGETICTAGKELAIEMVPAALEVVSPVNGVNP